MAVGERTAGPRTRCVRWGRHNIGTLTGKRRQPPNAELSVPAAAVMHRPAVVLLSLMDCSWAQHSRTPCLSCMQQYGGSYRVDGCGARRTCIVSMSVQENVALACSVAWQVYKLRRVRIA
ncbi:hypothetical protein L226DRAFT_401509 [Lentinus tigrinus ALCF2SS1-7]|uniref:Uncharacterized protein n=1 Tax=Lentinus tigrinus ALCF2SS1-6 TaxID=1328759 RepID=A0A5C2RPX6_9APHY|nr:hypothetical protein L227DRAFT_71443 [Lentinus tigrinus ALCF2SS1-6]RPD67759.1 hypothetical protein L226DRAFT_401509 [Lentinus tigrinus ALCF2SS1-7]